MGIGRYKDGKFDLILSIRHNADATRLQQWERSFKRASRILFDATDGQMQFGKLFVANNNKGKDEADAWLLENAGTSSSATNGFGTVGDHMTLKSDEKNKPFIIIHEFGHYGYGLYDEYEPLGGGVAECTGDAGSGACIMEFGWTQGDQIDDTGTLTEGSVNEFCTPTNHDPDSDTEQQALNDESCWETIADNYTDIEIPTDLPDAPIPEGHEDVEWILLAKNPRFVLVLDKSGSMGAFNAIAGVRFGADYWVRNIANTDDRLSIIAYNHGQEMILPLTTIVDGIDLTNALNSIENLTPGGLTNIGGAMSEGVSQITSPGDRAATQVMILFSDGLHNTGTEPERVIDSLIENGIRVYTIGFGDNADQVRLQQIAEGTGGRFEQIDADPDTQDAQLEIQNYLIEISGEVQDCSGIVTMTPGLLPEPSDNELEEVEMTIKRKYHESAEIEFFTKKPLAFRCRSTVYDHKAYIELGASKATFVVSYQEGSSVKFYLIRPNGAIANPNDPDVIFVNPSDIPYAFYKIKNPTHGHWIMRVVRNQARGDIRFKVFAFSKNKDITVGIKGIGGLYKIGEKIKLKSQVYNKIPLTKIQNPVVRIVPNDYLKRKYRLKQESVTLKQRLHWYNTDRKLLEKAITLENGVYESELIFDESGSYSCVVHFINKGKAKEALSMAERPVKGDEEKIEPPPVFVRMKRFQIHVGPLSKGKDVETTGKEEKS